MKLVVIGFGFRCIKTRLEYDAGDVLDATRIYFSLVTVSFIAVDTNEIKGICLSHFFEPEEREKLASLYSKGEKPQLSNGPRV
jgi:hypothetical protein